MCVNAPRVSCLLAQCLICGYLQLTLPRSCDCSIDLFILRLSDKNVILDVTIFILSRDKHGTQCKVCKNTGDARSSKKVKFTIPYDYLNSFRYGAAQSSISTVKETSIVL